MALSENLKQILNRIEKGQQTDEDMTILRQQLEDGERQLSIQLGKYNINIGEGKEVHIGDRIYYTWNDEALNALVRMIQLAKQLAKRPDHEKQLLELVREKIEERLEELPDKRINLDKEWQQDQIQHPEGVDLKNRYQGKIPEDLNIFDIFKKAKKQLLILGEPGTGKTTTMLVLAEALLNSAEQQSDSPIPVLLKLSYWKKEQKTMIDWLVEALKKEYPSGINKKQIKKLLIEKKLVLMMDELDELEEERRKNCVEAINKLLKGEDLPENESSWSPSGLVICSRRQEYETLGFKLKLKLKRAICLQALSDAQIQEYLRDRQREEFWQTLQDQEREDLRDVLQRPLFLRIVCDAMQKISINELTNFTSLEERQLYLSISYIRWCLLKESEDSEREKKIRLLIWLAQQLQNHGHTEFFIERMQPSWLPPGTRKWYILLVPLTIIFIFLLLLVMTIIYIYYIDSSFNNLNIFWYINIFIIGAFFIAISAILVPKIKVFEENILNNTFCNYNINLSNFRKTVILFFVGLLVFWSLSIIPYYVFKLIFIILFCWLLMFGISRLNGHELQQKTRPNQGIRNSAINAACVAIFIAITVATGLSIKFPFFPFKLFFLQFLSSLLMIGLPLGLICALLYGGLTCIQHFILRLILFCNGHPWNYAKFLDNAVKLKLLRRVGGRYEFIHSLLKECFAKLPDII